MGKGTCLSEGVTLAQNLSRETAIQDLVGFGKLLPKELVGYMVSVATAQLSHYSTEAATLNSIWMGMAVLQ